MYTSGKNVLLLFAALLFSLSAPVLASAPNHKTLKLACSLSPDTPLANYFSSTLKQALEPLGIDIAITYMPPDQGLQQLRAGNYDGSCGLPANFEQITGTQGLTSTLYPIYNGKYYVIRKPDEPHLKLQDSRVAVLSGHRFAAQAVEKQQPGKLILAQTESEVIRLLADKHADMAVIWEEGIYTHRSLLQKHNLQIGQIFLTLPLYPYLTKEHQKIITALGRRLPVVLEKLHSPDYQLTELQPAHKKTLRIICSNPINGGAFTRLEKLFRTALAHMGYNTEFLYAPRARATVELKSGRVDGDCARVRSYGSIMAQQAIIVEHPVITGHVTAYANSPERQLHSYQELTENHHIAYTRGTKFLSERLNQTKAVLTTVPIPEHALKMLAAGRIDFFIGLNSDTEAAIQEVMLTEQIFNAGNLHDINGYPYLHKKHKALVPQLTELLRKLSKKTTAPTHANQ